MEKLRKELLFMDMNEMKPNYAELARKHEIDWRTVKNIMKDMKENRNIAIKNLNWINMLMK